MNLKQRIEEVLEHYDYALVSLTGESTDNVVSVDSHHTTLVPMYNYLTIVYGGERVSKTKGKVKVTG